MYLELPPVWQLSSVIDMIVLIERKWGNGSKGNILDKTAVAQAIC